LSLLSFISPSAPLPLPPDDRRAAEQGREDCASKKGWD
jgi:hypothetical protein